MRIADPLAATTPLTSVRSASTSGATTPGATNDVARVSISSTARRLAAAVGIDSSKIYALKGTLAAGTFRVDHLRVAQAMLSGA